MPERSKDRETTSSMATPPTTYATSGLRVLHDSTLGRYVITERAIVPGETIAIWRGVEISTREALQLPPEQQHQLLQVGADRFLYTESDHLCEVDFINHSCDPNCGFTDAYTLVSLRSISPGESITFDYAMSDTNSFIEFSCMCSAPTCRGRLTGNDWQILELQIRYAGWFAPHAEELIRTRHP